MFNDQAAVADATNPDDQVELTELPAEADAGREQFEQLLVLSQAPLSLEAALEHEAQRAPDAAPLTARGLLMQYARFLALLIGVGMITAAVRHYSAAPKLYLGVGAGGALLFAIASTLREPRAAEHGLIGRLRFAGLSFLLAVGLGALVGGVLHFSAIPHSAAVLVPIGMALSIVAFLARDGRKLIGSDLLSAGITVAGLLVWLGVGLGMAAKKIDPPAKTPTTQDAAAGDHGEAAAGEHGDAAAGDHGEAAKTEDAAVGEHGEAAKTEDAAAAGHAESTKSEHGAAAETEHGAEAKTDAAAATEHGAAAKPAATAKSDHATTAAKSPAAATEGHGETAKAETAHGATGAEAEEEEDEVTAAEVLGPRKSH